MIESELERRALVLRERARKTGERRHDGDTRDVKAHAVIVSVGAEQFAIPSSGVREILAMPPVTRLPGAPPWIRGIVYCRGDIVSAISLGEWFGIAGHVDEPGYLALLRGSAGYLGMGVEEVVGFRAIHTDELTASDDSRRPVVGMTADLVALLDVDRLLRSEEVMVR